MEPERLLVVGWFKSAGQQSEFLRRPATHLKRILLRTSGRFGYRCEIPLKKV